MACLFQQKTVLTIKCKPRANKKPKPVEIQIRECRGLGTSCSRRIVAKSDRPKIVTASKFTSRNHYSGRPSTLKLYVDGADSGKYLLPNDLVSYVKIVFNVEANRVGRFRLGTIDGVESLGYDTVARFGVFNMFGPNAYQGRILEQIYP